MRHTKLALSFLLAVVVGCGGGAPATVTAPPVTPSTPSGPAPGSELLYLAGFGSVQISTLNPQTGVLSSPIDALPTEFLPENQGIPPILSPSGKFLYIQAFDQFDGHTVGGKPAIYCYSITGSHGELTDIPGVTGPPFVPQYPPQIFTPNAMVMDPQGRNLYLATSDSGSDPSNPSPHSIRQYSIDPNSGALTEQLPYSVTSVVDSYDLAMDPAGKYLFAESALFHSGIGISVFSIASATGAVTEIPGSPFVANGIITAFNGKPRIFVSPSGKYLYLNLVDQVYAFSVDSNTGALTALSGSPYNLNSPGLLALLLHPNGNFFYVTAKAINSANTSLASFPVDTTSGAITTTPVSVVGLGNSSIEPGPILINPDGQVLVLKTGYRSFSTFLINGTTGSISTQAGGPYSDGESDSSTWGSAAIVKFP